MKSLSYEKYEAKTQSWMNIIFSALFFVVVALVSEFLGIGDWIRRNAVWFVLFAIGVVELDLIGTIQQLFRFVKNDTENEKEELIQKIGKLELDVDYIKNTLKQLETELIGIGK